MISKNWAEHQIDERTSSVPLTYHYMTTIPKTSRKRRANPYLSRTTTYLYFAKLTLTLGSTKMKIISKYLTQPLLKIMLPKLKTATIS